MPHAQRPLPPRSLLGPRRRRLTAASPLPPRFVRARILLEDKSTGCVASMDDNSLCIILCRFSRAEHQMVLPLWQPSQSSSKTFEDLIKWHHDNFPDGARLSGAKLESPDDKDVWNRVASDFSP
jgi:hypothetical protein